MGVVLFILQFSGCVQTQLLDWPLTIYLITLSYINAHYMLTLHLGLSIVRPAITGLA